MGTTTLTLPGDAIGNFELAGLAAGTYLVRLLSTLDYQPFDTVFTVVSGRETLLDDTIRLVSTGIPVTHGLGIGYDSLLQNVTLTWNRPVVGRGIAGHTIYRKNPDSNSIILKSGWRDTVFVDSTAVQDATYSYRVVAIDSQGVEGVKSDAVSVMIKSSLFVITGAIVKGEWKAIRVRGTIENLAVLGK